MFVLDEPAFIVCAIFHRQRVHANGRLGIILPVRAQESNHRIAKPPTIGTAIAQKEALRDLWVVHVFWTRNIVIEGLPKGTAAAKVAEGALIANAKRVSAVTETFYRKSASDRSFALIVGHFEANR